MLGCVCCADHEWGRGQAALSGDAKKVNFMQAPRACRLAALGLRATSRDRALAGRGNASGIYYSRPRYSHLSAHRISLFWLRSERASLSRNTWLLLARVTGF